jgi:hypothetical protein
MAIFYTDTGSFNRLEVTGSAIVSGSLIVTGSTILSGSLTISGNANFGPSGLTGSLFGTSSWANNLTTYDVNEILAGIEGNTIVPADISTGYIIVSGEVSASLVSASVVYAATSVIADTIFVDSMIVQNNIDITNGTINTSLSNTPNPLGARVVVQDEGSGQLYITASILPKGLISSSQQFTSLTAPFTGSFTGSFTGALTHFSPSTLKLTVGTTAPASPAVNDLWVDTN